MFSNKGSTFKKLPDLKTVQNDFQIAERFRRDSLAKLQKISKVVHEFETKKKILQGEISINKERALYYENLLSNLRNKTEVCISNKNNIKITACQNKQKIQHSREILNSVLQVNVPDMEMYSVSQLQSERDSLLQKKAILEENVMENNIKIKKLEETLNNFKPNVILNQKF